MDGRNVLVFFDGSKRSQSALAEAANAARTSSSRLTVLTLAPVETPSRCCNLQTTSWNREMRRLAKEDAARARDLLPADLDVEFVIGEGRHADVKKLAAEMGARMLVRAGQRRGGAKFVDLAQ